MKERSGLIMFKETPVTLVGDVLKVGDVAPDFQGLERDLSEFHFSDLKGKIRIISVAPSLDTKVCELQTMRFNQEATQLAEDVEIVTVTVDLPFAQKRFCEAYDIDNIKVISDHRDLDFGYKYGLVMKELRLLARAIIVVDRDNIIQYFEVNPQVSSEPDYAKVLEVVQGLL